MLNVRLFILTFFIYSSVCQNCDPTRYKCDGKCVIPCDGHKDCTDGSDETSAQCSNNVCSSTDERGLSVSGLIPDTPHATEKFRCGYGGCIAHSFICGGFGNCWDKSDETPELCGTHTCRGRFDIKCDYGACIKRLRICDGKADCIDGSDETKERCKGKRCSGRKSFQCSYGACIEENKKCNNVADCVDGSDETPELCGAGHTYKERITFVPVPAAETATAVTPTIPLTPAPTPPPTAPPTPPPTRPPTAPPTPPPTPPPTAPPPKDFCSASFKCKCPDADVCVPCDRLSYCSVLIHGPKCRLPPKGNHGITVNVLSCGNQNHVDVASFSRSFNTLCSSNQVPIETVVIANCWDSATYLAQCREDGQWHPFGNDLQSHNMAPMKELCQPQEINSLICGRRPRFRLPVFRSRANNPQQQWPWLAAIYKNLTYDCTGTIITPKHILTAGHCVTESQDSSNIVALRWIFVRFLGGRDDDITEIVLHPLYKGGRNPVNDLAILTVKHPIQFSLSVVPACVATLHDDFPEFQIAATFDRRNDINNWRTVLQHEDSRCRIQHNRCRELTIEENQFCSIHIGRDFTLPRGSSGGPYILNNGTDVQEQWTMTGVISSASGVRICRQPYTILYKINRFWSWIDRCVHQHQCR